MSATAAPAEILSNNSTWEMTVAEGQGDFKPVPAGNHPARIAAILDCGTHKEEKTDDDKNKYMADTRKLVLVFELTRKQDDGKPFTIAQKYTWSMHEKSAFFKLVTGVTGEKFSPGQKFNPTTLLAKPVMVNVVAKGSGQKTYTNVDGVSQFPEAFPVPEFTYAPLLWSVNEKQPLPDAPWFPWIYGQSLHNYAAESHEGKAFMVPTSTKGKRTEGVTEANGPAVPPSAGVPTHGRTQPPADLVPVMAKCAGLTWPFLPEELARFKDDLTPREFGLLDQYAVPY